jgi:hypothetical protein
VDVAVCENVAAYWTCRLRARAFTIGFGIPDVCWMWTYGYLSYPNWIAPGPQSAAPISALIYAIGSLVEFR